jgi:hypothetical protein
MLGSIKGDDQVGKRVTIRALRVFRHGERWLQPGDEVDYDYVNARGLEHAGKAVIVPKESGFVASADVPQDHDTAPKAEASRARKEKQHAS